LSSNKVPQAALVSGYLAQASEWQKEEVQKSHFHKRDRLIRATVACLTWDIYHTQLLLS
jgi:hypothetical protein